MKILSILVFVLLLVPIFVSADASCEGTGASRKCCVDYDKDIPCSGSSPGDEQCFSSSCAEGACTELWAIGQYCSLKVCCALAKIRRFLFFIASGLAVIIITWAGVMYMTSGGGEGTTKAKKILLYGLIGAAIVFSSGFIMNFLTEILY